MTAEPPAQPEAELLYRARSGLRISIREAARRAGISENRWRQVEAGYQTVRAAIRVPAVATAATLAAMAYVVGLTPAELAGAGREDAARVLEEIRRREGVTVHLPPAIAPPRRPPDDGPPLPPATPPPRRNRRLPFLDAADEAGLAPFLLSVRRDLLAAAGLQFGPGREVPELPEVEEHLASLAGSAIFRRPHEVEIWNSNLLSTQEKQRLIALLRRLGAEAAEGPGEANAV